MADEDVEASGGGKSKLIIILVLALVLLLGGGGAAFLFLSGGDDSVQTEDIVLPEEEATPVSMQAIYVILAQPFVFNVTGDSEQRLVQVNVQLMVRGLENEILAKENLPLVEHRLLTTFGGATVEQLRTGQGKIEVRKQALDAVQAALEKVTGKAVVERVLFTGFVMQ